MVIGGPIAPGEDMLAHGRVVDQVPRVVGDWFKPCPDFVVELHDDGMSGAGLIGGDRVAVRAASAADTGAIVIAQTQDAITVRRLRRIDARRIGLRAEDAAGAPRERIVHLERTGVPVKGIMVGAVIGPRRPPREPCNEDAPENGAPAA